MLTHCGNYKLCCLLLLPEVTTIVFLKLGRLFFIISVVFYNNFLLSNHSIFIKNPKVSEMVFDSIRLFLLIFNTNGAS